MQIRLVWKSKKGRKLALSSVVTKDGKPNFKTHLQKILVHVLVDRKGSDRVLKIYKQMYISLDSAWILT